MYQWRVRTVSAIDLGTEVNEALCEDAKQKEKTRYGTYNVAFAFDLCAILPVSGSDRLFTVRRGGSSNDFREAPASISDSIVRQCLLTAQGRLTVFAPAKRSASLSPICPPESEP